MRTLIVRFSLLTLSLVIAGCSSPKALPKYEQPLARAAVMKVRTTAYTHTEADHVQYTNKNALGGTLQYGRMNSAAADWSRWPAGSIFRIRETGEIFQVDDYGWALAGTNTIDLYRPSRAAMNQWGVRRITIENLRWGDPKKSLSILRPRSKYRHIKRMVDQLEERMDEWMNYGSNSQMASAEAVGSGPSEIPASPAPTNLRFGEGTGEPAMKVATAAPVPRAQPIARAMAVQTTPAVAVTQPFVRTAQTTRSSGPTATREAFLNSIR